jgi:hypothetical protein
MVSFHRRSKYRRGEKNVIRQEDPPASRGRGLNSVNWSEALAKVAAGRGKWFRIAEYANIPSAGKLASYARTRFNRDGRFEIVSRTVDGMGVVYARLVTK